MPTPKVYQDIINMNKDIVLSNTWGHLYPKDNQPHEGYIIFTHSGYGDIDCIDCDFKDIDDSPWFFQDMQNYIGNVNSKPGNIYVFKGTYRKLKNQKSVFKGKVRVIKATDLLTFSK